MLNNSNKNWIRKNLLPANIERFIATISVLNCLINVSFLYLITVIIDRWFKGIIGTPQTMELAGLFGLALLRYQFTKLQNKFLYQHAKKISEVLVNKGCRHNKNAGSAAHYLVDEMNSLRSLVQNHFPTKIIIKLQSPIYLLVIMYLNPICGAILLVTTPLIPIFMALIGYWVKSAASDKLKEWQNLSVFFADRVRSLSELRLFGVAPFWLNRLIREQKRTLTNTQRVMSAAFLSSAVIDFFAALSIALIAVYIGFSLMGEISLFASSLDYQKSLLILMLAPEYYLPMRKLAAQYHDQIEGMSIISSINRDDPIGDKSLIKIKQGAPKWCSLIVERNQRKIQYPDFDIADKKRLLISGTSGSGKTTLLKILAGIEQPSQGNLFIPAPDMIAWSEQRTTIITGTAFFNITLGRNINIELFSLFAEDLFSELRDGKETKLGDGGIGLSGGQAQRLGLIRTLVHPTAKYILLDEPTAHLDDTNSLKIYDLLCKVPKDKTIIIASHDPHFKSLGWHELQLT